MPALLRKKTGSSNGDDDFAFTKRPKMNIRPRLPPPKTTLAAILFLIGGITCMCLGVYFYLTDRRNVEDRGLAIFLLGVIMFLPGSYSSFMIFASFREWPGYDYSQIPSYDDGSWVI
ncbi:hypothetical protein TrVE_jg5183 [Triparma verrucosa]|uniref:Transmembrane protein 230 n=1 Tax=Triparma verrucosa TaxID=1606542 RepID=A0A9W7BG79_9STRA|nr:hypothetical protein TrVE_jg5183 [Triparma verrucosa]